MAKRTGRADLPLQAVTDTMTLPLQEAPRSHRAGPVPAPGETEYPELGIFPSGPRPLSPVGHPLPGPPQV